MSKYNENKINYAMQEKLLDLLCDTICQLKTKAAIKDFLKDLLNRKERLMLVRRLLIADMLAKGETYEAIRTRLHCGNATIARIQRWLNFGRGGYKKALSVKNKK